LRTSASISARTASKGFFSPPRTVQLDDVVAEVGLDHVADLARLHREGGILEGLDHRAAAEEVQVAALAPPSRCRPSSSWPVRQSRPGSCALGQQRLGLGLGLLLDVGRASLSALIRMWLARRSSAAV
jgi:hypothetical protein